MSLCQTRTFTFWQAGTSTGAQGCVPRVQAGYKYRGPGFRIIVSCHTRGLLYTAAPAAPHTPYLSTAVAVVLCMQEGQAVGLYLSS